MSSNSLVWEKYASDENVVNVQILFSLCQNAVLFSLWRPTPVSYWQHLLTGHWGEVVSVSLLGNFTDHPQGKTHQRMITDNDIKMFTLLLWKMMTHVDTVLGQKILDYPENVHIMEVCLVYVCVYTCALVCLCTHLYGFVLFHWLYTHSCMLFSTGYGECLLDEPVGRTYELPTLLPGQIYNANRQCELMFGPGSQICPYMVSWLALGASKTTLTKWRIKSSGGSRSEMMYRRTLFLWTLRHLSRALIYKGQQIWNCTQLIAWLFIVIYNGILTHKEAV